jgi:hypothetical protein
LYLQLSKYFERHMGLRKASAGSGNELDEPQEIYNEEEAS